jgi:hypothetical protein
MACVGIPEMRPPELRVSPMGRLPDVRAHVNGPTPPFTTSCILYAVPPKPSERLVVFMDKGAGERLE